MIILKKSNGETKRIEVAPVSAPVDDRPRVLIKINNSHSLCQCDPALLTKLSDHLSYEVEGSIFARRAMPMWDGVTRLMNKAGLFPTGLLVRLVTYLKEHEIPFKLIDIRKKPEPDARIALKIPGWMTPRYYQNEAAEISDTIARGVFVMGTGCLTGDTIVHMNRGGNGRKYSLHDAYLSWIGERPHRGVRKNGFDQSIPTYTRSYMGDEIGANLVKGIVQSGIKKVWEVRLENGLSLKATRCHEFLTDSGFLRLDKLGSKTKIMCDLNEKKPLNKKRKEIKKTYRQFCLPSHPYAGGATSIRRWKLADGTSREGRRKLNRVPYHRVVYEAKMNGFELEEFIFRIRTGQIEGLRFLDPKIWAVHHKDHNHLNNSPDNLEMMSHSDHSKIHTGHDRFSLGVPSFSKVKSIKYVGEEMTYDIICDDPWRNFVANKMVVHNSGKTLTSAMVIGRKKVQTLFVAPDTGLREQAYEQYVEWFGHRNVTRDIMDTEKPIVVTNIQALMNKKPKAFLRFGMLLIDEFHHGAAKSYKKVNRFCANAFYRYGFTGTFMRPDGKDMEMHGLLSKVIFKKSTSELIEEGFLVRPYITIYRYQLPKLKLNYADAYNYITQDYGFHKLVAEIANRAIDEGKQTLVLVRRKEHGRILAELIPNAMYLSGDDDHDHRERVKQSFIKKKIRGMIATNIFGEGQDVPSIDVLVNARAQKTEVQTSQGAGRALRKSDGKEKAEIFDFLFIGQKHLQAHSVERIQTYQREPAFKIKVVRPE
jgi:hypothetical protein